MFAALLHRLSRHWRTALVLWALALSAATPASAAWVASPWAPEAGEVYTLARQNNGVNDGILVGGTAFFGNGTLGRGIVRLNAATLAQDLSFTADVTVGTGAGATAGEVRAIGVENNGSILIGGRFTHVNGVARSNIARLLADGTLDATYNASVNATLDGVTAIAVQPNDFALIGGDFTQVNGAARDYLVRLDGAGAVDNTFVAPGFDNSVQALGLQLDGSVVVGGYFNLAHGAAREGVVRLTSTGGLDASFGNPAVSGSVTALYIQPADGKVLIGGYLGSVGGTPRNGLARLHANGTLDAAFAVDTDSSGAVRGFARQAGTQLVLAGSFTAVNGTPLRRVARIDTAGSGTLDPTLTDVGVANAGFIAYTALSRSPTDVLIGGWFALVDGQSRSSLAQIVDQAGAPLAPAITQTQGVNAGALITLAPPANTGSGPVTGYSVTCTPQGPFAPVTVSGASPLTVPGLVNDTPYSCVARATNAAGSGPASAPAMVTPTASGAVVPVPTLSIGALLALGLGCGALAWIRQRRPNNS